MPAPAGWNWDDFKNEHTLSLLKIIYKMNQAEQEGDKEAFFMYKDRLVEKSSVMLPADEFAAKEQAKLDQKTKENQKKASLEEKQKKMEELMDSADAGSLFDALQKKMGTATLIVGRDRSPQKHKNRSKTPSPVRYSRPRSPEWKVKTTYYYGRTPSPEWKFKSVSYRSGRRSKSPGKDKSSRGRYRSRDREYKSRKDDQR